MPIDRRGMCSMSFLRLLYYVLVHFAAKMNDSIRVIKMKSRLHFSAGILESVKLKFKMPIELDASSTVCYLLLLLYIKVNTSKYIFSLLFYVKYTCTSTTVVQGAGTCTSTSTCAAESQKN